MLAIITKLTVIPGIVFHRHCAINYIMIPKYVNHFYSSDVHQLGFVKSHSQAHVPLD